VSKKKKYHKNKRNAKEKNKRIPGHRNNKECRTNRRRKGRNITMPKVKSNEAIRKKQQKKKAIKKKTEANPNTDTKNRPQNKM